MLQVSGGALKNMAVQVTPRDSNLIGLSTRTFKSSPGGFNMQPKLRTAVLNHLIYIWNNESYQRCAETPCQDTKISLEDPSFFTPNHRFSTVFSQTFLQSIQGVWSWWSEKNETWRGGTWERETASQRCVKGRRNGTTEHRGGLSRGGRGKKEGEKNS